MAGLADAATGVVVSVAGVVVITVMIFPLEKLIKMCQICRENNFVQHKMNFISFDKNSASSLESKTVSSQVKVAETKLHA
jgi:hypothetical protein